MFDAAYFHFAVTIEAVNTAVRQNAAGNLDEDAYVWLRLHQVTLELAPNKAPTPDFSTCHFALVRFTHLMLGQRLQIGDAITLSGRAELTGFTSLARYDQARKEYRNAQLRLLTFLQAWAKRHVTQNQQVPFNHLSARYLRGNLKFDRWLHMQRELLLDNPALADLQQQLQTFDLPPQAPEFEPAAFLPAITRVVLLTKSPLPRLPELPTPPRGFTASQKQRQFETYLVQTAKYRALRRH